MGPQNLAITWISWILHVNFMLWVHMECRETTSLSVCMCVNVFVYMCICVCGYIYVHDVHMCDNDIGVSQSKIWIIILKICLTYCDENIKMCIAGFYHLWTEKLYTIYLRQTMKFDHFYCSFDQIRMPHRMRGMLLPCCHTFWLTQCQELQLHLLQWENMWQI